MFIEWINSTISQTLIQKDKIVYSSLVQLAPQGSLTQQARIAIYAYLKSKIQVVQGKNK